jgi:phage tail sheath protein FI
MPEYLAPGVYVEETSFRSKSIEGVSTTTTGFVGPCRYGPVIEPADVITSLGEFERSYAGGGQLWFAADGDPTDITESDNFLWHAVRAFFTEGGKRLYIARIFRPLDGDQAGETNLGTNSEPLFADGHGRPLKDDGSGQFLFSGIAFRARFPGAASNVIVRVTARTSQNILGAEKVELGGSPLQEEYRPTFKTLRDRDVVLLTGAGSPTGDDLYLARYDDVKEEWSFHADGGATVAEAGLTVDPAAGQGSSIYVVTVSINVLSDDRKHDLGTWADLPLDPTHERAGELDSLFARFNPEPATISEARSLPLVVELVEIPNQPDATGLSLLNEMFPNLLTLDPEDFDEFGPDPGTISRKLAKGVLQEFQLTGGNDGLRPGAVEYEGVADPDTTFKTGLKQFEDVEDISIVAAPGSTAFYSDKKGRDNANAIFGLLIAHAELMRYRIAVLDSPPKQGVADVRKVRAKLDSKHAALYYPWVRVLDPVTRRELDLPPSGFVAGIYARNDINRAVYKAPANEVVNLAIAFEQPLNKAQQEVLNPEGINCFRYFSGRGFRLWGARTISSDPEWKYVNLRRYFAYLERSIDKGTQWAVFEPNGELLWANVRRTIEDFLLNEFQMGALLGDKPEKAYFVKCDRSTMTQNDLDNGRLVALIGVAALRPAEFVIFRIGQWTSDRKS